MPPTQDGEFRFGHMLPNSVLISLVPHATIAYSTPCDDDDRYWSHSSTVFKHVYRVVDAAMQDHNDIMHHHIGHALLGCQHR